MNVKRNIEINASPEVVYRAIATNEGTKAWWNTRAIVGEAVGEPALLVFDKQGTEVKMGFRVEILEPNRKIVWECVAHSGAPWIGTQLVYEINANNSGCLITFGHNNWPEQMAGSEPLKMIEDTWDHFMTSLKSYCETGSGQPWN